MQQNPYTGQTILSMNGMSRDCIPESQQIGWDEWDKQSWDDLTARQCPILCSDDAKIAKRFNIPTIVNLQP